MINTNTVKNRETHIPNLALSGCFGKINIHNLQLSQTKTSQKAISPVQHKKNLNMEQKSVGGENFTVKKSNSDH